MRTMMSFKFAVYIHLILHLAIQATGCAVGSFGEHCEFMCHCLHPDSCGTKGECSFYEPCETGYFGPSCQHLDIVQFEELTSALPYLRDGDENTCNPNSSATSAEVHFTSPQPLTFYRLMVNMHLNLLRFSTYLNDIVECSNERKYIVAVTMVDVTCDQEMLVSKLRIEGPVVGALCGILFSGGRNLALRMTSNQTSCSGPDPSFCASSNAIDGNISMCSNTAAETSRPKWFVDLANEYVVYIFRIFNKDTLQDRLSQFTLETFDSQGRKVMEYKDNHTTNESVFIANIYRPEWVKYVAITLSDHNTDSDRVLSLCEVEIYGDIKCGNGTYGINCAERCECKDKTFACSPYSGVCTPGCMSGFFGFNCANPCEKHCRSGICEHITGRCLDCEPGYIGPYCTTECNLGFYGPECKLKCSRGCSEPCNITNGECPCLFPFTGPRCTECTDGYYGSNCTNSCPITCQNNTCDMLKGECMGCTGNYVGSRCENCAHRFYGPACDTLCSLQCKNWTCHQVTGSCLSCNEGLYGDQCQKVEDSTDAPKHLWFLIPPLVCLYLLFVCMIRKKTPSNMERV